MVVIQIVPHQGTGSDSVHSEGIIYDCERSLVLCPTLPLLTATVVPNFILKRLIGLFQ